ncbi:PQQ-dependent sugar dehydrogenase [Nonomuraea longispora]|uniref:PQQ-dependent sugar dehydrogenase n=1 Tax=Nonomuraea longispora TaxID=1848320 RepID=UPI001C706417|nr:PQQ-dependent sugar dehydrogenase [Nonomuraea longispora]
MILIPRTGAAVTALLCALAVLPGCAAPESGASQMSTTPQSTTAAVARGLVPGEVTEIARGLAMPWGLAFLPDGSTLVSERASARILHIRPGRDPVPIGTVPGVEVSSEGGLLGLAVSPAFDRDRTVYAYVSASPTNRVVTLRLAPDLRSLRQERVIVEGVETADRHHGGRLRFGPDGTAYASELGHRTWDES